MMTRTLRLLVILGALSACAPERSAPRSVVPIAASTRSGEAQQDGAHDVTVDLRAPTRLRWISSTLAPAKPTIEVVVTNRGRTPVDTANLRVRIEAVRDDVPFRCAEDAGAEPRGREPNALAGGASFAFERTLGCLLPLTGTYVVRVAVSFGHGAWSEPRVVRTFALDVHAPEAIQPRAVDTVPGLFAAVGASGLLVGESGRGSGRIGVSLVNVSRRPLVLPPIRLALRVYRAGSPIPCEDEPILLAAPRALEPGASYREPVDVSCLALGVPGRYEIAVGLRAGEIEHVQQVEIGRLQIEISDDPSRRMSPLLR